MRPILLISLFISLVGASLEANAQFVRVFIMSGQSNMGGGTNPSVLTGAASDIWFDNSAATDAPSALQTAWLRLRPTSESGDGTHAGAAEVLAARFPGDRLAILKVTQGATGISYWNTPGEPGYERLMERITTVRARLDAQLAANEISGYAFEGFFWMQGEGEFDAYNDRGAIAYIGSLKKLVSAVEQRAGVTDLPTAIGRTAWYYAPETIRPNNSLLPGTGDLRVAPATSGRPYRTDYEYVNTGIPRGRTLQQGFALMVRGAQQFFQNEPDRRGAWAESDDLPIVDYFHFSTGDAASVELGRRMARGWMRVNGDTVADEIFVNAGPHRWAHPGTISFNPVVTGDGGAPLTVLWETVYAPSGASVSYSSTSTLATNVTITTPGTYALRVSVNTATGRKHRHTVNVIVYPADQNLPAYGFADPIFVERPLQRVAIGATMTNPDSDLLTYSWSRQLGNAAVTFEDPTALNTHARFHAPGGYTLRLAHSDGTTRDDGNSSGWVLLGVTVGTAGGSEFDTYIGRWSFDETHFPLGEIFTSAIEPLNFGVATSSTARVGPSSGHFNGSAYQQIDRTRTANTYPHEKRDAVSFAAWLRPSTPATGTQVIYDQGGGSNAFTVRLQNGKLQLGTRANSAAVVLVETDAPPADAWTHLVAVSNSADNSLRLYLNGTQVAATTHASVVKFGTLSDAAALGARLNTDAFNTSGTTAADFYTGLLDEVRVYQSALDTATIGELALLGNAPGAPGTLTLSESTVSVAKTEPTLALPVRRVNGSSGSASIAYSTADGTAIAGTDYSAVSGTLSWADGDTADKEILIPILNNPEATSNTTFRVQLTNPTGATLGTPAITQVTLTADNTPLISVQPITGAVTHTPFDLSATVSGIGPVTILWELQSGPGTLTIANPAAANTTATADRPGNYVVWLYATDNIRTNFVELIINVEFQNAAPVLTNAPEAVTATVATAFSLALPADTFTDPDGQTLAYSATLSDNSPLPAWLSFDATTRTFSGTPDTSDLGELSLKVTATDPGALSGSVTFTLTVSNAPQLTDYELWVASSPALAALPEAQRLPTADPDADGLANLLEYALGGDPVTPGGTTLPAAGATTVSGQDRLTLSFTPATTAGLRFVVEASSDLSDWSDVSDVTALLTSGQPHTHTDTANLATAPRRFLRLKISQ